MDYNKTARGIIDELLALQKEIEEKVEHLRAEAERLSDEAEKLEDEGDIERDRILEKKWRQNQKDYQNYVERELKKVLEPLGITTLEEVSWECSEWDSPESITRPEEHEISFYYMGNLVAGFYFEGDYIKTAEQELWIYRRDKNAYEAEWDVEYMLSGGDYGDSSASFKDFDELIREISDAVKTGRWFDCPKCKDLKEADDHCPYCRGDGNLTQLEMEERVGKNHKEWYNESRHHEETDFSLSTQITYLLEQAYPGD
jgi:hypothetical protein